MWNAAAHHLSSTLCPKLPYKTLIEDSVTTEQPGASRSSDIDPVNHHCWTQPL